MKVSQKFIDKISGKPELFERYCERFNVKKDFSRYNFKRLDFSFKNFNKFNFSYSDFSYSDFSYSNFSYSDFRGGDFSYSNFRGSDFSGGDFRGSDFSGGDFSGSDFSGSNFRGSDFSGSDFRGGDFSGGDFSYSDFRGSNFRGSNFSYSDFRGGDFRGSNFRGSDFSGGDFRGSNFRGSDFSGGDFRGSDFSGSKGFIKIMRSLCMSNQFMMNLMFEKSKCGLFWIAYKSFGEYNTPPKRWKIKFNSKIKNRIDANRFQSCSYGINVGTLEWCKLNCSKTVYEVYVPLDSEICAPHYTDGKIRVNQAVIKRKVKV